MNVGTVKVVNGTGWSPGREAPLGTAPRWPEEAAARDIGQDAEVADAELERVALDTLNQRLAPKDLEAHFSRDETTNRLVVKVVNRTDNTVIWQIPNEKVLALAAAQQQEAGLFVNQHV